MRLLLPLGLGVIIFGGCISIRPHPVAEKSQATQLSETTTLGKLLAPQLQAHAGLSGFKLLEYGREALVARTALAG
jgi:hypothetical protein